MRAARCTDRLTGIEGRTREGGRPGVTARLGGVEQRLGSVEHELHPHPGGSLREAVDRAHARTRQLTDTT
ncbi:MAG TPA: hypothetical protein DD420_05555 [Streptomyces sp.]|nr:hypothetical protein [Streptomyces sp.]